MSSDAELATPVDAPPPRDSTSRLLAELRRQEPSAPLRFWEHWFPVLRDFFQIRLRGYPSRTADEEDLALDVVYRITCEIVAGDEHLNVESSDALWQVMQKHACNRLRELRRYDQRLKRRAGRTRSIDSAQATWLPDRRITAGQLLQGDDEIQRFLASLPNETLRHVVLLRLDGFSVPEIAEILMRSLRSIERDLGLLRGMWQKQQLGSI